jgi:hypothetical protein
MNRNLKHIAILTILIGLQNFACAQASEERKLIIGVWMAEDKSERLEFKTNGECIEFVSSDKSYNTYTYNISDTMPVCITKESINPKIKTTFLKMIDKKDGLQFCYEINGFSAKTLSLRILGRGGFLLFNRVK